MCAQGHATGCFVESSLVVHQVTVDDRLRYLAMEGGAFKGRPTTLV